MPGSGSEHDLSHTRKVRPHTIFPLCAEIAEGPGSFIMFQAN